MIKIKAKIIIPLIIIIFIIIFNIPALYFLIKENLSSGAGKLLESMAITSLMVNSPEGTAKLLEERFSYETEKMPSQPEVEEMPNSETPPPESIAPVEETPPPMPEVEIEAEIEATQEKPTPPDIPAEYSGILVGESFAGADSPSAEIFGDVYIRNSTDLTSDEINDIISSPADLGLDPNETAPQVLIYHTHGTESFEKYDSDTYDKRNDWRSTDNNENMITVGEALVETLEANGISTLHSRMQHDYPSYTGSYERSAVVVNQYLEEYPSIKVIIDLHRDALEREGGVIVKPITEIDGEKAAQIMIMVAKDDENENWENNLRFAADLVRNMEMNNPSINRPIYFREGKYNQSLADNALLIEMGSHANTLEEAIRSAEEFGISLATVLKEDMER